LAGLGNITPLSRYQGDTRSSSWCGQVADQAETNLTYVPAAIRSLADSNVERILMHWKARRQEEAMRQSVDLAPAEHRQPYRASSRNLLSLAQLRERISTQGEENTFVA
jgi:hypothetical protein